MRNLLTEAVGRDECERLTLAFTGRCAPQDATDITASFDAAYGRGEQTDAFDYTRLTEELYAFASQPVLIGADVESVIASRAPRPSYEDVFRCAKQSLSDDQNMGMMRLDAAVLTARLDAADREYMSTLPAKYVTLRRDPALFVGESALSEDRRKGIFADYRTHTPERWLTSVFRSPLTSEQLAGIRHLRDGMLIPDPLINALSDFAIYRSQGRYNLAYIKKVAASLASQDIFEPEQACGYFACAVKRLADSGKLRSSSQLFEAYQRHLDEGRGAAFGEFAPTAGGPSSDGRKEASAGRESEPPFTGFEWME